MTGHEMIMKVTALQLLTQRSTDQFIEDIVPHSKKQLAQWAVDVMSKFYANACLFRLGAWSSSEGGNDHV